MLFLGHNRRTLQKEEHNKETYNVYDYVLEKKVFTLLRGRQRNLDEKL